MTRRGADAVTDVIEAHGNKTVFSLGGAQHYRLLDTLDRRGVRIVGGRHESAVVAAADGYARVTGRAGVAIVIAEQGVANAYAGLVTARYACSPIVVVVARFPLAYDDPRSDEEISQLGGLRDVVKWARTIPHQDRLGEYVEAAFRIAEGGRPGPVILGVQADQLDGAAGEFAPEPASARATCPTCSAADAAAVAELVAAAERPVVIAGAGARYGNASAPLTALAEDFGIPVIGRGLGRGVVDETSEGGWSWSLGLGALEQSDLVVSVGARFNQRLNYGLPPRFRGDARLVQVDVAAEELGGPRNFARTVVSDAGAFASALHSALREAKAPRRDLAWVAEAAEPRRAMYESIGTGATDRPHPAELARRTSVRLDEDAIVVADGANVYGWLQPVHRVRRCPGWMDHSPLGSMGIGTGLAVGAACAAGDEAAANGTSPRPVLLYTGDGAFGYFTSELSTMSRHGLSVLVVVGNDGAWGTELHGQLVTLGRPVNTELGVWDYARVAEGFGCRARTVAKADELEPALDWAFAGIGSARPILLNVEIDTAAGAEMKTNKAFAVLTFHALVNPASGIYPSGAPVVPLA